jgi:hypothetical protein
MSDETKQEKRGYYLLHIDGSNKARAIGALLKEPDGTAMPGAELSEPIAPQHPLVPLDG